MKNAPNAQEGLEHPFTGLTFTTNNLMQSVYISESVLRHFELHKQTSPLATEAGGQLFASISDEALNICEVTGPYNKDTRKRFFFRPNRDEEKRDILRMFSQGLHYVGDWHTHPERYPAPSATDYNSATDRFRKSIHQLKYIIVIISGTAIYPEGLWVSIHNQVESHRLVPINVKIQAL